MKTTQVLLKQNIGWYFKRHWKVQGKRTPVVTSAEKILNNAGFPVYKAEDITNDKKTEPTKEIDSTSLGLLNKNHPNWHERVCYSYKDNNVLLEGLDQAKIITKTVEIKEGLPDSLTLKNASEDVHKKVKNIIFYSHLFDAEQKKLPKIKDPERPAWNFPRIYGITDERANKLLVIKLLQLTEMLGNSNIVKQRSILNDLRFSFPFEKAGDLIQLQLRGDTMLLSSKPLSPISQKVATESFDLPDIFPIKHTITLNVDNIYEVENIYPVNLNMPKSHPHTIFVHYNKTEVKNLYEEEVTESQILGRSLMKTFTVAAAYAKQKYGDDVKELPSPVTIQCIHTDGRLFHFGVLQLNTLNLEEGGVKNVWYQQPRIPLFSCCGYREGLPVLEDYNGEVINYIIAMYNNV